MEVQVAYEEGHAHVAAIRLLQYRLKRPPTLDEVAEALGSKPEITNHRLRALQALGIVRMVENPFDVHISVGDHLALEKLPAEVSEALKTLKDGELLLLRVRRGERSFFMTIPVGGRQ